MGKNGTWVSAVKKAFSYKSRETKDQTTHKSQKKWFKRQKNSDVITSYEQILLDFPVSPPLEGERLSKSENDQSKLRLSSSMKVVPFTSISHFSGKSRVEIAAIKIQSGFRGYMARRVLRALRGLVRLKSVIKGQNVKRQATTTLRSMQTLVHVQSLVRETRIRLSEKSQTLQQHKHHKVITKLRASIGEEWDHSNKSKEQIEAKLQNKQEAATRRERALSYAFSHQQMWRNSSKSSNPTLMNGNNPEWGWSWLEQWMAARPWETKRTIDDHGHGSDTMSGPHDLSFDTRPPPSASAIRLSPSRQPASLYPGKRKSKQASPRASVRGDDDETRSIQSGKSERHRRHSIGGSSVKDYDRLIVPSYMAPTESAKAKEFVGTARKRLSSVSSPASPRK